MAGVLSRGKWTRVGCAVTPIAFLIGLWSGGAGHGDYVWARVVYPFPAFVLASRLYPIVYVFLPIGLLQFVGYGLLMDSAEKRGTLGITTVVIAMVHFGLVAALFAFVRWPD